jgi:hypothetical protein
MIANLLAAIGDPTAAAARLAELQKSVDTLAKAQAKLDAARAAHDQKIAADRVEIAVREQRVRERELDAAGRHGSPRSSRYAGRSIQQPTPRTNTVRGPTPAPSGT